MNSTVSQLLLQNHKTVLDCDALLEQACSRSDSGYYSASGSLSPASSIDSCCLSPPSLQCGARQEAYDCDTPFGSQVYPQQSLPVQTKRRTRSKYPGKKRQSASDREKLRMRDLTKALHHLRTYLPPSVAPVGQTLTKIQTLRLTIRYISHLSEQLELSEEASSQRRGADVTRCPALPEELLCYKSSAVPEGALQEEGTGDCQYSSMPACSQQDEGTGYCQYSSMPACSQQDEGTGYCQYSSMPACSQQDQGTGYCQHSSLSGSSAQEGLGFSQDQQEYFPSQNTELSMHPYLQIPPLSFQE
ncbi:MESP2 protein, partial [Polyodon spathula]|nr:MESP2 protein [Polyodon spathula]